MENINCFIVFTLLREDLADYFAMFLLVPQIARINIATSIAQKFKQAPEETRLVEQMVKYNLIILC